MKVLVVHDRQAVRERIVDIVEQENNSGVVRAGETYASARDLLSSRGGEYYDLLIIDLTLPRDRHDKSPPSVEHAQSLIKELFAGNELIAPGDIIGISNDVPAVHSTVDEFSDSMLVLLKEDHGGSWEGKLRSRLRYLKRALVARTGAEMTEYGLDVLVVTALDKEAAPYDELFELDDEDPRLGVRSFVFSDLKGTVRKGALFSVGQAGQAPTASATQALITRLRPRLVVMSGYCGGIRGKVKLGDVIVFESSYAWDNGKWIRVEGSTSPVFRSRPTPIAADGERVRSAVRKMLKSDLLSNPSVFRRGTELARRDAPFIVNLHSKPAGSGSAVVSEAVIAETIRDLNEDIWAVDMESYGLYFSSRRTSAAKPEYICIKSVSDFCDHEKDDSVQAACSFFSAYTAKALLSTFYDFPES